MIFTRPDIQQFREQGYVIKPKFFNKREVAALQAEVVRLKDNGFLRNVATDGDGKTHSTALRNLQLCPMYRHSTFFRALPFKPKVIQAVSELLGDPTILHLDQVFLKPGGDGMGTHWHQDNAYFKISDPMKGTAMWIAVHDATVVNGTLHVIPGSYREAYEHSRDPYSDHHIRCYPPEERAVPVELPAGGVIFFCYGTAHCTRENKTDRERAGVAYHFLRVDYAQPNLIEPDRDYRPYLTGPLATGGVKEYGVRVAGTWKEEVERAVQLRVKSEE
ncbi:MAG: phytanoyl-CoA dioxygenase family protein [Candidatus Latescibacteria bacterium]|nr:phytanoyl-CoA dioxygenase family protein [Candidatus Latescibacterota bacterium]